MRSVFTWSAVLMMAVFATACVEGDEGVDGVDGLDDSGAVEGAETDEGGTELPAPPDSDAARSPQSLTRSDDPDEGGQVKPKANLAARPTATR